MAIEAVTFDFWNTLVRENTNLWDYRSARWLSILGDAGFEIAPDALDAAFEVGWQAYVVRWTQNTPFGAAQAVDVVLGELGIQTDSSVASDLLSVIIDPPDEHRPDLNEHVGETLEALHHAGVRVGIICDVGLTPSVVLRRYLTDHGVLDYFDHWSFSDEVGVYKPDATIFRHALDGLGGIAPGKAAHVGDLRRTDIMGAKAMGMTAVRYAGVHDDPIMPDSPIIEGDHVITDQADLLEVLGVG